MVRRSTLWLVPILVLTGACNRSEKAPADDNGPFLTIERMHSYSVEPGAQVVTWNLSGRGVKELKAHLLFLKDGKRLPGKEIVCRWDEVVPANMHAEMVYLLQEGEPFGSKNKRVANLDIAIPEDEPDLRIVWGKPMLVEDELVHSGPSVSALNRNTIASSKLDIVFETWFSQTGGGPSGGDTNSLRQTSKGGRAVIAIALEWKPVDKR